jgi:hypothetical protein
MPVLTFKYDTLKPDDQSPNVDWNLPAWIDSNEAILRATFDPEICVAGVLQDENWRGYRQHSVIVKYVAAPAAFGYSIAISEQTIYDVQPQD